MSESAYRLFKAILLSLSSVCFFILLWKFTQTNRYIQYDIRANSSERNWFDGPGYVIDTWTGEMIDIRRKENGQNN